MRVLLSVSVLVSVAFSQSIPTVVLTGEPRVIARRILNVDLKTAQQLALPDDQEHIRSRVNIVDGSSVTPSTYLTGEPQQVVVYRRILRPARITFTGEGVVTDNWKGTSDALEMESWTLSKRPVLDGSFVQPQSPTQQFHL